MTSLMDAGGWLAGWMLVAGGERRSHDEAGAAACGGPFTGPAGAFGGRAPGIEALAGESGAAGGIVVGAGAVGSIYGRGAVSHHARYAERLRRPAALHRAVLVRALRAVDGGNETV
jgi:hypothetical protein